MNWSPQSPDFNPIEGIGVKGKDCMNGLTLLSSILNLGEILMQLWMEINVVTLYKVVKIMPKVMRSVIKAKGSLLQKASVQLFWGKGSVLMNAS